MMSLSKVSTIEHTEAPKLTSEIIDIILGNFDDDDRLEIFKKCRLISTCWYKRVQESFHDEYFRKCFTHFDGSQHTFAASRTFDCNIFGEYKLAFPTLRISNSEYYLIKTMLGRLVMDNLQNLELKDNRLTWKEVIMVLGQLSKITNLKFIESPKVREKKGVIGSNSQCSRNMYEIFQDVYDQKGFKDAIQDEVNKNQNFLANLKSFEVDLIHLFSLNTMSMIVSCSECQLENFSIKFNLEGPCKDRSLDSKTLKMTWVSIDTFGHFEKYSESMKRVELYADDSNIFGEKFIPGPYWVMESTPLPIREDCLKNVLSKLKPGIFTKLESLKIKVPKIEKDEKLSMFINSHENLKHLYISMINSYKSDMGLEEYDENNGQEDAKITTFQNHLQNLMVSGNNTPFGREPLEIFSENVISLTISKNQLNSFNFSNQDCPIFQSCRKLTLTFKKYQFELELENVIPEISIIDIMAKCPNLTKLIFFSNTEHISSRNFNFPQLSIVDLQLIIGHYVNLTVLHLEKCVNNLTDTGITGLTEDAIQLRLENPDLPIEPQEITGLPISHLKELETLVIKSETPLPQITDLSAKYGFIGMKKLKKLEIGNTKITREGFEILKDNTGSKKLAIF